MVLDSNDGHSSVFPFNFAVVFNSVYFRICLEKQTEYAIFVSIGNTQELYICSYYFFSLIPRIAKWSTNNPALDVRGIEKNTWNLSWILSHAANSVRIASWRTVHHRVNILEQEYLSCILLYYISLSLYLYSPSYGRLPLSPSPTPSPSPSPSPSSSPSPSLYLPPHICRKQQ